MEQSSLTTTQNLDHELVKFCVGDEAHITTHTPNMEPCDSSTDRRAEIMRLRGLQRVVEPLLNDAEHILKLEHRVSRTVLAKRGAEDDINSLQELYKTAREECVQTDLKSTARSRMHDLMLANADIRAADALRRASAAGLKLWHARCATGELETRVEAAAQTAEAEAHRARELESRCGIAERALRDGELSLEKIRDEIIRNADERCERLSKQYEIERKRLAEVHDTEIKTFREQLDVLRRRCDMLESRAVTFGNTPVTTPLPTPKKDLANSNSVLTPVALNENWIISPAPLKGHSFIRTAPIGSAEAMQATDAQLAVPLDDARSDDSSRSRDSNTLPFMRDDLFSENARNNGQSSSAVVSGDHGVPSLPKRRSDLAVKQRSTRAKRPRKPPVQIVDEVGSLSAVGVPMMTGTAPKDGTGMDEHGISEDNTELCKDTAETVREDSDERRDEKKHGKNDRNRKTNAKILETDTLPVPASTGEATAPTVRQGRRSTRTRPAVSYDFSAGRDVTDSIYSFMPFGGTSRTVDVDSVENIDASFLPRKRKSMPARNRPPSLGTPIKKGRRKDGKSGRNT